MDMEIYNAADLSYEKTLNTISFFSQNNLGKFPRNTTWKLKVWLDEEKNKKRSSGPIFSCGMALTRPHKGTLYVKKIATNLSKAIKEATSVLEHSIAQERAKFRKNSFNFAG